MYKEVKTLKKYKVYVTDLSQAQAALAELNIPVTLFSTYLTFECEEQQKMDVILHLNKARVVVYDIEEC